MKRKIFMSTGILALFLLTGALSFAQMRGWNGTNSAPALTQDQKDKIFKIENTLKSDTATMQTDLQQLNYDLQKILTSAAIDDKQALALHAKITALQDKIGDKRFQANLDVLKVLTPEQRQNFGSRGMMGGRGIGNKGNFQGGPGNGRMGPGPKGNNY